MEEIRLSQTHPPSSASSATSESSDCLVSMLVAIDEQVIADQVLRVRREHCKGLGCIIKDKRKEPDTSYLMLRLGHRNSRLSLLRTIIGRLSEQMLINAAMRPCIASLTPLRHSLPRRSVRHCHRFYLYLHHYHLLMMRRIYVEIRSIIFIFNIFFCIFTNFFRLMYIIQKMYKI